MRICPSLPPSLRPSVRNVFFFECAKAFSTIETAGDYVGQREVIGSDERGREGGDEGGAIRKGASEEITRATHLTAVYPALLLNICQFLLFPFIYDLS